MRPIGVAGAGTMGAGIAALAAEASLPTLLYDPDPEALARAPEGVEPVRDLKALAPCGLVIEAAPEDLEVKRALFARLAGLGPELRDARAHRAGSHDADHGTRALSPVSARPMMSFWICEVPS